MGLGPLTVLIFLVSTGLAQSTGGPGCASTPVCTYVNARDLGTGAMCGSNYCNCGGVAAPPMTIIIAGTSTVGCNYLTKPTVSQCPEGTGIVPAPTLSTGTGGSGLPTIPPGSLSTTVMSKTSGISPSESPSNVVPPPPNTNIPGSSSTNTNAPGPSPTNTNAPGPSPPSTNAPGPSPPNTNAPGPSPPNTNAPGPAPTNTNVPGPSNGDSTTTLTAKGPTPLVPSDSATNIPGPLPPSGSASDSPLPTPLIPPVTLSPGATITSPPASTTSGGVPPGLLPIITLSDPAFFILTSVDPSTPEYTAVSTSDGSHPPGLYPFIHGGPKCFFCPPGLGGHGGGHGGFILWGMSKPGIYPPPVPPPVPGVPWPTITIGPDHIPTPGPNPESDPPEDQQKSQKSEKSEKSETSQSCTTTTASSCAVSCTTPAGQSIASCATKCEAISGCSVTNIASTTTKSGSCAISNWATIQAPVKEVDGDWGDQGPEPSYGGSVPAWVTAAPSGTGAVTSATTSGGTVISTTSSGGAPTPTSGQHNFCVPYANPRNGESYCTCDDHSSRSFVDDKGHCPTTSPASGVGIIPTPTPEPPKTDSYGNVWNSTDLVAGTIWGCKSTSVEHGLAPVPITHCLSSTSVGMDFTPTPAAPSSSPTSTITPEEKEKQCRGCKDDMGASRCGASDNDCIINECKANSACQTCEINCSTFAFGSLGPRHEVSSAQAITSARPQQMSNKLSRRNLIVPAPTSRFDSLSHPLSLYKRAPTPSPSPSPTPHRPTWVKYAPTGFKIWKILGEKALEDREKPKMCELDDYFIVTKKGPKTPSGDEATLLEKIGVAASNSYYDLGADGPKEEPVAWFNNAISAEQGVFFANDNHRGEERDDDDGTLIRPPIEHQMSTVAWWQWKHTVLMGLGPDDKAENADFSKIRYFFRVAILNKDTVDIMQEALGNSKEPKDFTPADTTVDNAFWPLLGSPNGNGIGWFLIDYKKSLNGKTIEKITAWRQEVDANKSRYFMWATLK